MTPAQLEARVKELEECLAWYVQEDDTQEHLEGNTYWVRGKQRAMKALGIETEKYDAEPYL